MDDGEIHYLSHDGHVVITVQQWSDPAAAPQNPRRWLRTIRNGRVEDDREFVGPGGAAELAALRTRIAEAAAPTLLTEQQAWRHLAELAQVTPMFCGHDGCGAALPLAANGCPSCHRHAGQVTGGFLSGARRRGLITWRVRNDTQGPVS